MALFYIHTLVYFYPAELAASSSFRYLSETRAFTHTVYHPQGGMYQYLLALNYGVLVFAADLHLKNLNNLC